MPYLELIGGVPLYYEDHGAGRPVILIHNWTVNGSVWTDNVSGLMRRHRVIVLDLRGHGRSGKTPYGHTLDHYARDVRALISALHLDDVALVGWSMGASVVLAYVREYGCDGLRSLCLVEHSPRLLDGPGWDHPLFGSYTHLDLTSFVQGLRYARAAVMKPLIEQCFAQSPPRETVDAVFAETMQTPTDVAVSLWMDMANNDLRPVLSDVTVPALVVSGERSRIFPGAVGDWVATALPKAEQVGFPASGHTPFAEEPERFNAVLGDFLTR